MPTSPTVVHSFHSCKHWTRQKQISDSARHLIFYRLSPFNCFLGVVLQLDKGDYPEKSRVLFCPNKQRCFEPFMYLDPTENVRKNTDLLGQYKTCNVLGQPPFSKQLTDKYAMANERWKLSILVRFFLLVLECLEVWKNASTGMTCMRN